MRAEPDPALLELAEGARGSPFLLMELLSGLRDEHHVRVERGQAELIDARLPLRVRDTMRERLRRVSEPAREVAVVAASLGRRFSFSELATMLDQPPSALLSPVEELIQCGVLIEGEQRLAFLHDITRDAVRASLPVSARSALDRQAADVLLAAGATPVEVASQLASSAEPGDEVAITTLFKAAEVLAVSDPGAAADLSRRAFELAPSRHPLRGPLVAQTALLLHAAGRIEEARAFADTSLRETLPAEQEARVRLSIAGMFSISPDVRVDAGRQALALPDLPPGLRAQHLACVVHNLIVGGHSEEARANLAEARCAVTSSRDATALFMLDFAENGLEYVDGRFERALELTETAARSDAASHDPARECLTRAWRCEVLSVLDRLGESLELAAAGVAAAQRDRQGWGLRIFENWRGRQLLHLGRLNDAAAILEGQFSPEDDERHESVLDVAGVVALGRVAIHTGDARQRRRTAALAHTMLDQGPLSFQRHAVWLLALQAMADGNAPGARAWLCALGEEQRKSIVPFFPLDVTDDVHLVRIAIGADDRELAESTVAAAERRAENNPHVRMIAASAAHARGLLTDQEQELQLAVELFDGGPRPLSLASALEDLGVTAVQRGAAQVGLAALGRALAIYTQSGASWDARRVRSRLRAQGVRRRLVTARRTATGWAAMTDSELAVAQLVAQGFTNREVAQQLFVSPHTVSSHLRNVFAKLDVNSRAELTRLADDHDRRETPAGELD
jgi:DNA-binding CsgD family transcriptional regulator